MEYEAGEGTGEAQIRLRRWADGASQAVVGLPSARFHTWRVGSSGSLLVHLRKAPGTPEEFSQMVWVDLPGGETRPLVLPGERAGHQLALLSVTDRWAWVSSSQRVEQRSDERGRHNVWHDQADVVVDVPTRQVLAVYPAR